MEETKFVDHFPIKTLVKWHRKMGYEEAKGKWKEKLEQAGLPTSIAKLEAIA